MKNDSERLRRLCVMALLCAMAYAAVALIRIPAVAFLKYEPKDVLLVIGGFLLGPLEGAIMCAVVAAVENGICPKGQDVTVKVRGGELIVRYTDDGVTLTGDTKLIFTGEIRY